MWCPLQKMYWAVFYGPKACGHSTATRHFETHKNTIFRRCGHGMGTWVVLDLSQHIVRDMSTQDPWRRFVRVV